LRSELLGALRSKTGSTGWAGIQIAIRDDAMDHVRRLRVSHIALSGCSSPVAESYLGNLRSKQSHSSLHHIRKIRGKTIWKAKKARLGGLIWSTARASHPNQSPLEKRGERNRDTT
jgi:hypothetical protein